MKQALLACLAAAAAAGCFKADVNVNLASSNSNGGGWGGLAQDVTGMVFASERGVLFYAYDTLAIPGEPVDLAARIQSAKRLKGLPGITVGFFSGGVMMGSSVTNQDGRAIVSWIAPRAGDYLIEARPLALPENIDDDYKGALGVTPAPLLVSARARDAEFVIVDLDHTVVESGFARVLFGGAKPMPDSAAVMARLARRYSLIYLTHRPDMLTPKSKSWLKDNGFPAGPLLVSELREAFGDSGTFKTARLAEIRGTYPNVRFGIGDKMSDAQAYVDNGIGAYLIPYFKEKPKDMRAAAGEISRLRGQGRLQVVSNWRQIEQAVFSGAKFAPEAFVRQIESRANALEAKERSAQYDD